MEQAPEDLKSALKKLRVKGTNQRKFIPGLLLRTLLSEAAIRQALLAAKVKSHAVDEAARHVLRNGFRIFAILVLVEQVAATPKFIEEGELYDDRLPFEKSRLSSLLPTTAVDDFEESQWEVNAPSFSRGTIHKSLRAEVVLPFTSAEHIGKGAFGEVFEVTLHPKHQQLEVAFQRKVGPYNLHTSHSGTSSANTPKIVRKALENAGDHRVELENLANLSHLRHPNIVELLASYTYDGKHNLIFPLAEGGTLEKLFEYEAKTTAFRTDLAFFMAMAGLSSAIECVHNFTENRIDVELMGCHYDLRPKNILVSEDSLILADFGLSRFKEMSEDSATNFKNGALDYQAPECEDLHGPHFQKHVIRRSSDIWSFGCVLAEMITYMMRGPSGIRDFRSIRRFKIGPGTFRYFHCGRNEPNPAVQEWLSQLIPSCSRTKKMLLDLIKQMLSLDEKERPKAKEVTGTLRLIALCEASAALKEPFESYLQKTSSSLDALIEHARLHSWQYALGLLEQQCTTDLAFRASAWRMTEFLSTLDHLRTFEQVLASLRSRHSDEAMVPLYRLSELNDCLDVILDDDLQNKSELYFKAFILQSKGEPALKHVQETLSSRSLPSEIRMRAVLKHMTQLAMRHSEEHAGRRQLVLSSIRTVTRFEDGDHSIGSVFEEGVNRPIFVEWRESGHQSADEAVHRELFSRTDAIAEMLGHEKPRDFCALDCKGFFHNVKRSAFGLAFQYPQASQSVRVPQSLHTLLQKTSKQGKLHPTLDDRFWIAYKLCRSVLEFHLVGWLHKRLSSMNVLFFPTSEHLEDDWFRTPYVVGFSHSRPDEISAYTGGPDDARADYYQHPLYFAKRRYCAEYDYYSLGVVLLEIGLWDHLNGIMRKLDGPYEQVRQYLIQKRLPLLKQTMGRTYYEAVKWCLEIDPASSEVGSDVKSYQQAFEARSLQLTFDAMVVQRLAKLSDRS